MELSGLLSCSKQPLQSHVNPIYTFKTYFFKIYNNNNNNNNNNKYTLLMIHSWNTW
jgi:hypothetical protein